VLEEPAYLEAAERACEFIESKLRDANGRLLARYRDGEAAYLGYVDDYAFLIWGLTELYEAGQEPQHLKRALELADDLLRLFWDEENGGLFFYGSDGEQLIARPKEIYDGATPSGNGVAAYTFLRLFYLTGRSDLRDKAERLLTTFAGSINQYPIGYSFSLLAMQLLLHPVRQVVIAGPRDDERAQAFLQETRSGYAPFTVTVLHDPTEELGSMAEVVRDKVMQGGEVTAYICENFACRAPITDREQFQAELEQTRA
jgi:uncharacterized protein